MNEQTYRVTVCIKITGVIMVEAESMHDAKESAKEMVGAFGVDAIDEGKIVSVAIPEVTIEPTQLKESK